MIDPAAAEIAALERAISLQVLEGRPLTAVGIEQERIELRFGVDGPTIVACHTPVVAMMGAPWVMSSVDAYDAVRALIGERVAHARLRYEAIELEFGGGRFVWLPVERGSSAPLRT